MFNFCRRYACFQKAFAWFVFLLVALALPLLLSAQETGISQPEENGVSSQLRYVAIDSGYSHTCALSETGSVYCWGESTYGRLGSDNRASFLAGQHPLDRGKQYSLRPIKVSAGIEGQQLVFTQISAGGANTCGVTQDNQAYCWGAGYYFQLGNGLGKQVDGRNYYSDKPVRVRTLAEEQIDFRSVTVGENSACGISTQGIGYCWGRPQFFDKNYSKDYYGGVEVDIGYNENQYRSPAQLKINRKEFMPKIRQIETSADNFCALTLAGATLCWGLDFGNTTAEIKLRADGQPAVFTEIAMRYKSVCALTAEQEAFCWNIGKNGTTVGMSKATDKPTALAENREEEDALRFRKLSLGYLHSCGITTAGFAYCWGEVSGGLLGIAQDNQETDRDFYTGKVFAPVRVSTLANLVDIAVGGETSCAIDALGQAFCWGKSSLLGIGKNPRDENGEVLLQQTPTQVLPPLET